MRSLFHNAIAILFLSAASNALTKSKVKVAGKTGISGMQLVLIDNHRVIVLDKAENNPLQVDGHPAWGEIYDFKRNENIPLNMQTNTFCAAGSFLSNGSFVSTGGNPAIPEYKSANGYQGVRIFDTTCESNCEFYENSQITHLTSDRWYPTTVRLPDGGIFIGGGDTRAEFVPSAETNNPTAEFFPPRGNGMEFRIQFLSDMVPFSLFPYIAVMPDGQLFFLANNGAMLYDYVNRKETRLPSSIPTSVVRTYPQSAAIGLLPLTLENNYTATIIACGGSNEISTNDFSSKSPADDSCAYISPLKGKLQPKWTQIKAPSKRIMGEFQHLPDGTMLLLGGGTNGLAGFGNARDVVGQSNSATPNLQPEQFHPDTMTFTTKGWAPIITPRMYHSSTTILPNGTILLMGSNPNGDVETNRFRTEYDIDIITPPYLLTGKRQPILKTTLPDNIDYGNYFTMKFDWLPWKISSKKIRVTLMDTGFATHGVKMDHRAVKLEVHVIGTKSINVKMINSANIYPPGPAWIFVMVNGVPMKEAQRILVGKPGHQPPVSAKAVINVMKLAPYDKAENAFQDTKEGCHHIDESTCTKL